MYLTIPLCIVSAYTSNNSNGTLATPTSTLSPWAVAGLKNGYINLVQGVDLTVNGKTVNMYQPNINCYTWFKLASQLSQDDLKSFGTTLGLGEQLDNAESIKYNPVYTSSGGNAQTASTACAFPGSNAASFALTGGLIGGNGIVNNSPFSTSGSLVLVATQTAATASTTTVTLTAANTFITVGQIVAGNGIPQNTIVTAVSGTTVTISNAATSTVAAQDLLFFSYASNAGDQSSQGIQFTGTYNNGYFSRLKKYTDVTNGTQQNLYGSTYGTGVNASTIMTETFIQNEFKSYSKVSGNYIITYDTAIIRLQDLMDSVKNLGLLKRFDGVLRIYINSGTVSSVIQEGGYMLTSGNSTTFVNTCPIVQSCLQGTPATACGLATGLFVARATSTSLLGGVNLASSNAAHSMTACRIYYPLITLKPEYLIPYISENRSKKIVYTDVLYNAFNNISSGSTFSALVQSGVSNIRGVLIIPFISSTIYGSVNSNAATGTTTLSQYQSPFDTAPCTNGPLSLINLQVSIGGQNILQNTLNYSWENFLEQVTLYEKINQGDLGLSCGLFNQFYWENAYRVYYVDCTRGNKTDMGSPRNVNISFNNNSNVNIDIMVFTETFKEIVVDVETGIVSDVTF